MGAAEEILSAAVFAFLHGCEAGLGSVNNKVIFSCEVHYVRAVLAVTKHLMKMH